MKCNQLLAFGWKSKKSMSNGKTPVLLGSFPPKTNLKYYPYVPPYIHHTETCNGKIIAKLELEDDPYFGGISTRLNIRFQCIRCEHSNYSTLPKTIEEINELLTKYVEKL